MTNFQRDLIRYLETTESAFSSKVAEDFFYGETGWKYNHRKTGEPVDNTPEGWANMNVSFEFIDHYGGEGQGDDYWTVYKFDYWTVYKFTDNNTGEEVYIKFDGWYASYNGAEYADCFVVQPKEKTVVVYE